MKDLSIIIVNFRSSRVLRDCLLSLREIKVDGGTEIIIYDNGPEEPELQDIKDEFPEAVFISDERFISFAAANNKAADRAAGRYYLFLNPDTYVKPDSVEQLLSFIKESDKTGVAGPRLTDRKGNIEKSFGRDPGILSETVERILRALPKTARNLILKSRRQKGVEWISGAAMLVKKEAFDEVGGFDESYPLYFEDSDICRRIRRSGWSIRYYPTAEIIHLRGGAGGVNIDLDGTKSSDAQLKYRQSQLRYYSKHHGGLQNKLLKMYLVIKMGKAQRSQLEKTP